MENNVGFAKLKVVFVIHHFQFRAVWSFCAYFRDLHRVCVSLFEAKERNIEFYTAKNL